MRRQDKIQTIVCLIQVLFAYKVHVDLEPLYTRMSVDSKAMPPSSDEIGPPVTSICLLR